MSRLPTVFAGLDRPEGWPRTRGIRPAGLERSVETLAGVGPALRQKLAKLGLRTVRDLLEHRPRGYQRAVGETAIADLAVGGEAVIAGEIRRVTSRPTRRRVTVLKAAVRDESAEIAAVWFNQPWLEEKLRPGTRVRLRGQLRRSEFHVRSYDVNGAAATADFAPIYPASEEVSSSRIRALVELALSNAGDLADPLPARLKASEGLPLRADAVAALHRPRSEADGERARRRLAFDELLLLQVGLARIREGRAEAVAPALGAPGELVARYRAVLPFELTPDQER
ncbi:MAG: OB-fold nucleic acid binding domain-containing protein, partial [Gaiellaceae bacterium]